MTTRSSVPPGPPPPTSAESELDFCGLVVFVTVGESRRRAWIRFQYP